MLRAATQSPLSWQFVGFCSFIFIFSLLSFIQKGFMPNSTVEMTSVQEHASLLASVWRAPLSHLWSVDSLPVFAKPKNTPLTRSVGGDCVKIVDVVTPFHRNLLLFCFALSHRWQKHYRFEYLHGVGAYLRARLELRFGIGGHWNEGFLAHAVALPHKWDSCCLWCFTGNISCLTACVFHLQVESGLLIS